jgi:hypothetical protein
MIGEVVQRLKGFSEEQLLALGPDALTEAEMLVEAHGKEKLNSLLGQEAASFDAGPLLWLTRHTRTENPNYQQQRREYKAPLPRKSYFVPLFNAFLSEEKLLVAKTRQMLTSLSAVGYATWRAQFFNWDCLIQSWRLETTKEVCDYAAAFWRNQDDWLRERFPLVSKEPLNYEVQFINGGRVKAIPGGADKVRGFHPTLMVFDEFSIMEDAEQCWNTAAPVTQHMIGIGTARAGWMGDECSDPGDPLKPKPFHRNPEYPTDRKEVWER